MKKELWLCIIAAFWCTIVGAQEISELSGTWDLLVEGGQTSTVEMPGSVVLDKNKKCQISCVTKVPNDWSGDEIYLYLEQPLTDASIYVNEKKVPSLNWTSLHDRCKITELVEVGEDNRLTIMFDKGLDIKGNPNKQLYGVLGRIELEEKPKLYGFLNAAMLLEDDFHHANVSFYLYNDLEPRDIRRRDYGVMLRLFSYDNGKMPEKDDDVSETPFQIGNSNLVMDVRLDLKQPMKMWDLSHPKRYLLVGVAGKDYMEALVGFRELRIKHDTLYLNREPVEVKQKTLDLSFVQGGAFPQQVDGWLDLFGPLKDQGYNMVRFVDFYPTEDAYLAADALGMLLLEAAVDKNDMLDRFDRYGLHPSFLPLVSGKVAADGKMAFTQYFVPKSRKSAWPYDKMSPLNVILPEESLDLSGKWAFSVDGGSNYDGEIFVPGSFYTEPISYLNYKKSKSYSFKRNFVLPDSMKGRRLYLSIGGITPNKINQKILLNDKELTPMPARGTKSIAVSSQYDITNVVNNDGTPNTLVIMGQQAVKYYIYIHPGQLE